MLETEVPCFDLEEGVDALNLVFWFECISVLLLLLEAPTESNANYMTRSRKKTSRLELDAVEARTWIKKPSMQGNLLF